MSSTRPETRNGAFIESLERLVQRKDRGALAALRRGLGQPPGEVAQMYPYVVPWLPQHAVTPRKEDAYYQIAALFAFWYQGRSSFLRNGRIPNNLGASLARLADATASESVERRFVALLNCHSEDLPDHLRHAVGLLRTADIPVDWDQLLRDIQDWGREDRRVQRSWARSYWGHGPRDTDQGPISAVVSSES
ncbi:CRISPR-associated protein, Cse2 family [Nitrolancea hollandica Lb]|uniref:CRISPR-associated protein, Cse2 family n=2 Tax=Nitrolancea hollandica TaxID=1206749 RepID=I4EM31_9BACT|nr:CRISPR-associated protein, Cse2 family [Nitrolancea hollandica Lb]